MFVKKLLVTAALTVLATIMALNNPLQLASAADSMRMAPPADIDYTPPESEGYGCYIVRYIDIDTLTDLSTPTIYIDLIPGDYIERPMPIPGYTALADLETIPVKECKQSELQFFYLKNEEQATSAETDGGLGGGESIEPDVFSPPTFDASKILAFVAMLLANLFALAGLKQKRIVNNR
ncbi:MAG: hypothetical protein FWG30_08635 [Eubacteriaceae bacterium]|nr:hypothetical protein [Eubacteriaceae bacterium]